MKYFQSGLFFLAVLALVSCGAPMSEMASEPGQEEPVIIVDDEPKVGSPRTGIDPGHEEGSGDGGDIPPPPPPPPASEVVEDEEPVMEVIDDDDSDVVIIDGVEIPRDVYEALMAEEIGDLSEIAPAAGESSRPNHFCQAFLIDPQTLELLCRERRGGLNWTDRRSEVAIEGGIKPTLQRIAREIGGEGAEIGRPEITLCTVDIDYGYDGTEYYRRCAIDMGVDPDLRSVFGENINDDGSFEEGRVVHHAPDAMVIGQPYFLELAIQPLTASTSVAAADASLRAAVGTGLAPDSNDEALGLEFTTVKASELMAASLIGTGFEITPLTDELQPLLANEQTLWKWQVVARDAGNPALTFSLDQALVIAGREVNRSVKTITVSVEVQSLDKLLGDPNEVIEAGEAEMAAADLSTPESLARANAAMGPALAGCEVLEGSDPNRHALLMTNLAYSSPISVLSETHEDGTRLTAALANVGFTVTHCRDLDQRSAVRSLSKLGRTAKSLTDAGETPVTFFYYSGHGASIDGTNYILPVDLDGASSQDIRDGGVKFEDIFNRVSSTVAPTSFVVFDACRTVMDDESRGLVRMYEPVGWASGVFQAFATEPGKTAADDGVYSAVLAELMPSLNEPANVLFKRVQDNVAARTGDRQRPVYTDGTTGGDFYFSSD